ncbi:MAG: enoyl-CoA hydratase/isomerase family protein [Acidimicrobiales bacterium]|nr:enoyl-CoA hydratase/isomerase family protein [Acidimicrobiales bacterium]
MSGLEATEYGVSDRVATITLSRPDRLNAWTAQMNAEYRSLLQRAADDPDVHVIVVTGSGRGFCAGADADDLAGHADRGAYDGGAPDDLAQPGFGVRPEFDAELAYHFGVPKPIVAAVNGPAAGIGFALACYCDVRFCAEDAKLTTAHGRLGLPCPFGLAWLLPRLIGLAPALDIILTSRVLTGTEAAALGLAARACPRPSLTDEVGAYAARLAATVSPASLAVSKRQVYEAMHQSAAEAVRSAQALLDPMMAGADYREGVTALREKRPPRFAGFSSGAGAAQI